MADFGRVWWLATAVACQFVWGVYPAALRYLQTKATEPLTSLQLSFLINLLACPALLLGSTIPAAVRNAIMRRRQRQRQAAAQRATGATSPLPRARPPALPMGSGSGGEASPAKARLVLMDSALAEPLLGPEAVQEQHPAASSVAAPAAQIHTAEAAGQRGVAAGWKPGQVPPHMASSPPEQQSPGWGPGTRTDLPAGPSWQQQAAVLAGTTFFLSSLLLAQVFSLLFTTAYLSQMVFLLAPVIVALLARALFRQPLPHGLWPALALMLLGCGMVIGSKAAAAAGPRAAPPRSAGGQPGTAAWMVGASAGSAPQRGGLFAARGEEAWLCTAAFGGTPLARLCAPSPGDLSATASRSKSQAIPVATARGPAEAAPRPDRTVQPGQGRTGTTAAALRKKRRAPPPPAPPPAGPSGLGLRDACGILLSLLGACCLAGFMLLVQRCSGVVSNAQVLWANFATQSALTFVLLCCFERGRLPQLLHLGLPELGAVATLAGGINWGANLVQQMCIQRLGAPATAAFLPVRLLGSLAASYPLLSEGLEGPAQWGGCAVLLAAVSWYLVQQKKAAEHCAANSLFEADVAAGGAAAHAVRGAEEP